MHFDPRNILVIDFGQLGDVILSLPALRAISERFPDAKKSILVGSACAEIARMSRLFDEVIELDRVRLLRGNKLSSSIEIIQFAFAMRRRNFDFVIDLHSLPETNLLGFFTGAKHRLFANRESRSIDRLSNFRPRPTKEDKTIHLTENYLAVLKPLGVETFKSVFKTLPETKDLDFARKLFENLNGKRLIGICPGAGHSSRRWPLEKFCRLAEMFAARDDCSVICFLGPEEEAVREKVSAMLPEAALVVHGINLRQLTAAFSLLSAIVGNDTGTMHLAASVGTPIVLLLSDTAPERFLPLADNIREIRCENINDISEEKVLGAVTNLLSSERAF